MGMFDQYVPKALICPACLCEPKQWQGKDGPCCLYTFIQGKAESEAHEDFDGVEQPGILVENALSSGFLFYSYSDHTKDCPYQGLNAIGIVQNGIWVDSFVLENCLSMAAQTVFYLPSLDSNELREVLGYETSIGGFVAKPTEAFIERYSASFNNWVQRDIHEITKGYIRPGFWAESEVKALDMAESLLSARLIELKNEEARLLNHLEDGFTLKRSS